MASTPLTSKIKVEFTLPAAASPSLSFRHSGHEAANGRLCLSLIFKINKIVVKLPVC